MPSNDDKLKALSEAIQRGLEESKELQEEGALEIRQMEENVRSNISAIGDILKAELSKKPQKAAIATEILIETPEEPENTVSDDSLKSKILELGSILHSALTTAKPVVENIQSPEPQLITEPVEEAIVETVIDFDEEKAQENISNNFAKIADLIKRDLKKELVPERPVVKSELKSAPIESKQSEEPNTSKNNIINNYVNILDKISKDTPTEAKVDKNLEPELSPSVLKYINEQVTALRVQIGHAMESGGGTVAQQFADGGTMNGSLDVIGQILSGGVDISTLFGQGGTISSPNTAAYYGSFYDDTTQLIASDTTAYPIYIGHNAESYGVSLSGTHSLLFNYDGVYNIQFSVQLTNSNNGVQDATIWLRKNNQDVDFSAGVITVPASHGQAKGTIVSAWNYVLTLSSNDLISLWWHATNPSVALAPVSAGTAPIHPISPTIIITAQQVASVSGQNGSNPAVNSFVVNNSASILSVNSTVSSNSANWNTAYTLATGLTSLSSNWQNTFTTVSSNSANWNGGSSAYTTVNATSSTWVGTTTTLSSNSANWNYAYSEALTNSAFLTALQRCISFI